MAGLVDTHVARDAAEPEDRELFVVVVGLKDASYILDSLVVLILGAHCMKRLRVFRVPIRRGIVNSNAHANLPTRSQHINKAGFLDQLKFFKVQSPCWLSIQGLELKVLGVLHSRHGGLEIGELTAIRAIGEHNDAFHISVGECGEGNGNLAEPRSGSPLKQLTLPNLVEIARIRRMTPLNLHLHWHGLRAHSHASRLAITPIISRAAELHFLLALVERLSAHHDLSSFVGVFGIAALQLCGEGLGAGSHDRSH